MNPVQVQVGAGHLFLMRMHHNERKGGESKSLFRVHQLMLLLKPQTKYLYQKKIKYQ